MWLLHTTIVLSLAALSAAVTLENYSSTSWKRYKHIISAGNAIYQHFPTKSIRIHNPGLLQDNLSVLSRQKSGLNFDTCGRNSDCARDRGCYALLEASPTTVAACPPLSTLSVSTACLCLPEKKSDLFCTRNKQCEKGETCRDIPTLFEETVCTSKAFSGDGDGLTGDECRTNSDCKLPRRCLIPRVLDGVRGCFPLALRICTGDRDCDDGEICITEVRIGNEPICISEDADFVTPVPTLSPMPLPPGHDAGSASSSARTPTPSADANDTLLPTPVPSVLSPTPAPAESADPVGGLTFDLCQADSDCQGSRECIDLNDNSECNGGDCRCIALDLCDTDDECSDGERCVNPEELGFEISNAAQLCVSRDAEPAVCIGAHSLKHLSREELVFERDALANVLCDMNDSCATPGHMVVYKRRALMMKSYCEMTECVRKVMRVNSPKYSRGLTIPSQTGDLVFTAFAARFETLAEEGVLSAAVRLGL